MIKKSTPRKARPGAGKPKPQPQTPEPPIRSPYDEREAPEYREHDDFREWLMRDK